MFCDHLLICIVVYLNVSGCAKMTGLILIRVTKTQRISKIYGVSIIVCGLLWEPSWLRDVIFYRGEPESFIVFCFSFLKPKGNWTMLIYSNIIFAPFNCSINTFTIISHITYYLLTGTSATSFLFFHLGSEIFAY